MTSAAGSVRGSGSLQDESLGISGLQQEGLETRQSSRIDSLGEDQHRRQQCIGRSSFCRERCKDHMEALENSLGKLSAAWVNLDLHSGWHGRHSDSQIRIIRPYFRT